MMVVLYYVWLLPVGSLVHPVITAVGKLVGVLVLPPLSGAYNFFPGKKSPIFSLFRGESPCHPSPFWRLQNPTHCM